MNDTLYNTFYAWTASLFQLYLEGLIISVLITDLRWKSKEKLNNNSSKIIQYSQSWWDAIWCKYLRKLAGNQITNRQWNPHCSQVLKSREEGGWGHYGFDEKDEKPQASVFVCTLFMKCVSLRPCVCVCVCTVGKLSRRDADCVESQQLQTPETRRTTPPPPLCFSSDGLCPDL